MIKQATSILAAGMLFCNGAAPLLGQAPAPPPKREPPVIRVTTRLIQVNVIVQDKKGEPVPDLTKKDFTLLEAGKEQLISFFAMESSAPRPAAATPLPPNSYANRMEQRTGAPTSVTIILLDGLNTAFSDQAYAKNEIIKFLGQIQPHDRVALYLLGRDLRVLHDFTGDTSSLLRVLARHKGRSSAELSATEPEEPDTGWQELDQFLREANQPISDFYMVDRVRRTAKSLEAIAPHLAGLPGRKNLIWVSGSFPFSIGLDAPYTPSQPSRERRTFSDEIERATRALNNAGMAVYPVNARGLIGGLPPNAAASRRPQFTSSRSIQATHDTMVILAERTGGRAFYNTNDIRAAIRQAIEDTRVTYVLGYYPSPRFWEGRFHEIKVRVKRPGVNVRHRRGFFALADPPQNKKQREATLRDAVWSPLDANGVGHVARLEAEEGRGAAWKKVTLKIDRRDVTLEPKGDRWLGAIDLLFIQQNPGSKVVGRSDQTVTMTLKRATYEDIVKDGLVITKPLKIEAEAHQLRVFVRDQSTGAVGTVTIPLKPAPETPGRQK